MNLQEILTYVEELSFKNSMFGGYDKDEVDIQLDKICDEVEALVTNKDKEIEDLRARVKVLMENSDVTPEELSNIFAEPAEDMISREEYDAVVEECAQLKTALEKAQFDLAAKEANPEESETKEAFQLLVGEVDAAQARANKAEAEAAEAKELAAGAEEAIAAAKAGEEAAKAEAEAAKAELEALKAEVLAWQEAEAAKVAKEAEEVREEISAITEPEVEEEIAEEVAEEIEEEVAEEEVAEEVQEIEETEEIPEEAPVLKAPENTDQAYTQYMMYADLLCKQLAEVETKHAQIVDEATVEADKIRTAAQEEADQIIAEAQEAFDARKAEADQEAESIINKAKEEAEAIGKEYMENATAAKAQCDELAAKKESLVASLNEFGEEIAALISKVQ